MSVKKVWIKCKIFFSCCETWKKRKRRISDCVVTIVSRWLSKGSAVVRTEEEAYEQRRYWKCSLASKCSTLTVQRVKRDKTVRPRTAGRAHRATLIVCCKMCDSNWCCGRACRGTRDMRLWLQRSQRVSSKETSWEGRQEYSGRKAVSPAICDNMKVEPPCLAIHWARRSSCGRSSSCGDVLK